MTELNQEQNQPIPQPNPSDPFALDLSDDTPLPVLCNLEDGTCESCQ